MDTTGHESTEPAFPEVTPPKVGMVATLNRSEDGNKATVGLLEPLGLTARVTSNLFGASLDPALGLHQVRTYRGTTPRHVGAREEGV